MSHWKQALVRLEEDEFVSSVEVKGPEERKREYEELQLDMDLFSEGWEATLTFKGFPRRKGYRGAPHTLVSAGDRHSYTTYLKSGAYPTQKEAVEKLLGILAQTPGWEQYKETT